MALDSHHLYLRDSLLPAVLAATDPDVARCREVVKVHDAVHD
jgi:hypothetical protein